MEKLLLINIEGKERRKNEKPEVDSIIFLRFGAKKKSLLLNKKRKGNEKVKNNQRPVNVDLPQQREK